MEKIKILIIGRHTEILQTVVRLVNNNPEWHGIGFNDDTEALDAFTTQPFHLVLLGGGINEEEEEELRAALQGHNPAITIVQHYGGGSGLLTAEIYEALNNRMI